jgi:hypothetical protein
MRLLGRGVQVGAATANSAAANTTGASLPSAVRRKDGAPVRAVFVPCA